MTDLEMKQNAGKERIIDLLKGKFDVLETSMRNELGTQIYGDGTGNSSKDIGGLQLLVADDPTTGTVGGINRANFTFWRNQLWDFSVESVTTGAILRQDSGAYQFVTARNRSVTVTRGLSALRWWSKRDDFFCGTVAITQQDSHYATFFALACSFSGVLRAIYWGSNTPAFEGLSRLS